MRRIFGSLLVYLAVGALSVSASETKKILLLAGKQSHGPGDHEFRAGCLLLKRCLDTVPGVTVEMYPNGPYPHIVAASGRPETMMWVYDRPDGGRGFGFTGGHKHVNWANENFRKVVLNAILWIAKADIPPNGVIASVEPEEIPKNLDPK